MAMSVRTVKIQRNAIGAKKNVTKVCTSTTTAAELDPPALYEMHNRSGSRSAISIKERVRPKQLAPGAETRKPPDGVAHVGENHRLGGTIDGTIGSSLRVLIVVQWVLVRLQLVGERPVAVRARATLGGPRHRQAT